MEGEEGVEGVEGEEGEEREEGVEVLTPPAQGLTPCSGDQWDIGPPGERGRRGGSK